MKSFHFSLGDSSKGPVGFCARVTVEDGRDEEDALAMLKDFLPEEHQMHIPFEQGHDGGAQEGIEYVNVYFNPDAITAGDIDEMEEIEELDNVNAN